MLRARQRRMRAARPWLIALGVVLVLGLLAVIGYTTPVLGVSTIEVRGASLVTADEVRAAADVPLGTPLAQVPREAAGARVVAALPAVQRATVRRSWPNRLVIDVVERVALAAVPVDAGYGVIDAAGVVFVNAPNRPPTLPEVRLANPGPHDPTTRAALTVVGALPDQLRDMMVALVADAPTRIKLLIVGDREVIWGDATDNDLKSRVTLTVLAGKGTVFDVSAPRVVTVK
jgi:cell division protein FtsQ